VWRGVAPAPVDPSPNFQAYDSIVPSGSVDPTELKAQVSPSQVPDATAVGDPSAAMLGSVNRKTARERQSVPSTPGPLTTVAVPATGLPALKSTRRRLPSADEAT
jgi:hypothetical protein